LKTAINFQASSLDEHIHELDFVHRDLKPENLLLSSTDEAAKIKIVDFGLARKLNGNRINQCIGTSLYMAPEVIRSVEPGAPGYGQEADMWSAGVIIYVMLCGWAPFNAPSDEEIFDLIKEGEFQFPPDTYLKLSDEAKNLISSLLTQDTEKRLSIRQILQHPWITGTVSDEDLVNTRDNIKSFQAKKKFKGAVNAIKAANRFGSLAFMLKGKPDLGPLELESESESDSATAINATTKTETHQQAEKKAGKGEKEEPKDKPSKDAKDVDKMYDSVVVHFTGLQAAKKIQPSTCTPKRAKELGLTTEQLEDAACRFQVWEEKGVLTPANFFNLMSDILKAHNKSDRTITFLSAKYFAAADKKVAGAIDWGEFLVLYSKLTRVELKH